MAAAPNSSCGVMCGTCSGNARAQNPRAMAPTRTMWGIMSDLRLWAAAAGSQTSEKLSPPRRLAELRNKTNPSPGGERAWKPSSSPIPRKPAATRRTFPSVHSAFRANSTRAIRTAANPPHASTVEWRGTFNRIRSDQRDRTIRPDSKAAATAPTGMRSCAESLAFISRSPIRPTSDTMSRGHYDGMERTSSRRPNLACEI